MHISIDIVHIVYYFIKCCNNYSFLGVELETITYSLFTVKIALTPKGLQNTSQVVATALQYINMLERLSEPQWQPLWKDYTEIAKFKFNFNFKELKEDPTEYIS